jgi:hypothetical protein
MLDQQRNFRAAIPKSFMRGFFLARQSIMTRIPRITSVNGTRKIAGDLDRHAIAAKAPDRIRKIAFPSLKRYTTQNKIDNNMKIDIIAS